MLLLLFCFLVLNGLSWSSSLEKPLVKTKSSSTSSSSSSSSSSDSSSTSDSSSSNSINEIKSLVFSRGENGYYCIKIPVLLRTFNGTLIAFGEGRRNSCSDWTWTDLVYKLSYNNGITWSDLHILRTNSTNNETNVIGNAAPVQDRVTNRIWVPHCRNNREFWLIFSDTDGETWSEPIGEFRDLNRPHWEWIGTGPPGSLQLSNNRIIVPSYHAEWHVDGDITKGHVYYSDNSGKTWNLSENIYGSNFYLPSETQAVQLINGSVLFNSRAFEAPYRIFTLSHDGGNTFESSYYNKELRNEVSGCEGSTIRDLQSNILYYSGITPSRNTIMRYNMTIHRSIDNGTTWEWLIDINNLPNGAAYSSLISMTNTTMYNNGYNSIGLLYEMSIIDQLVFVPDYMYFELWIFQQ